MSQVLSQLWGMTGRQVDAAPTHPDLTGLTHRLLPLGVHSSGLSRRPESAVHREGQWWRESFAQRLLGANNKIFRKKGIIICSVNMMSKNSSFPVASPIVRGQVTHEIMPNCVVLHLLLRANCVNSYLSHLVCAWY
jgi:hypothetical protein